MTRAVTTVTTRWGLPKALDATVQSRASQHQACLIEYKGALRQHCTKAEQEPVERAGYSVIARITLEKAPHIAMCLATHKDSTVHRAFDEQQSTRTSPQPKKAKHGNGWANLRKAQCKRARVAETEANAERNFVKHGRHNVRYKSKKVQYPYTTTSAVFSSWHPFWA